LHEALATWAGALEERIVTRITAHTTAEITKHVTASEERMTARMSTEIARHVTASEERMTARMSTESARHVTASEERMTARMSTEIARHVTASEERIRADMHACFEPHDGVPERVTNLEQLVPRVERLEAKVFASRRSSRPTKRRVAKRR
jgi:hypothetical protein